MVSVLSPTEFSRVGIVIKALAQGKDPGSTKAGELGLTEVVTIGADDSIDETLRTMFDHKARRLPAIDG